MNAPALLLTNLGIVQTMAANLLIAANPREFDEWANLINFRPSTKVQEDFIGRGPGYLFHNLEGASDPNLNLDLYTLKISTFPTLDGNPHHRLTPREFAKEVRNRFVTLFNSSLIKLLEISLVDPAFFGSAPTLIAVSWKRFSEVELKGETTADQKKWESDEPVGAVMRFLFGEKASVIVSDFTFNDTPPFSWTFSTVRTPDSGRHPVSGCRQFGIRQNSDQSYSFFTKAAERSTTGLDVRLGKAG